MSFLCNSIKTLGFSGSFFWKLSPKSRVSRCHLSAAPQRDYSLKMKVAVIGSGISGAVCASTLAENGVSVSLFESGRGPGGRMSQRRETTEDGKELLFDHGAPYFIVNDEEVMGLVKKWEARGLVAEWKERFGSFDQISAEFVKIDEAPVAKKYVGVPGMSSICKALCLQPGVEAKFGLSVATLEWPKEGNSWLLTGLDGKNVGHFDALVASDKIIAASRFSSRTGRPPPLDKNLAPELIEKLEDIPVRSCFALMLGFSEPLSSVPVKGFEIKNSEILSWAFCDSSKPGRRGPSGSGECWVLHSTAEYAENVIKQTGLKKPTDDTLAMVAKELLQEFRKTGLPLPQPFFMKAHRWGSAFPAAAVAGDEKCLWDEEKRLAFCGDFCVSPSIEGAILSGLKAARKLLASSGIDQQSGKRAGMQSLY